MEWCVCCRTDHEAVNVVIGGMIHHVLMCPLAPPGQLVFVNLDYIRMVRMA